MLGEPERPGLTAAQWIQVAYPDEPNWSEVADDTLVELVEDFSSEQACATIAIGLLTGRQHARAEELARWLQSNPEADQWLKFAAGDSLDHD